MYSKAKSSNQMLFLNIELVSLVTNSIQVIIWKNDPLNSKSSLILAEI